MTTMADPQTTDPQLPSDQPPPQDGPVPTPSVDVEALLAQAGTEDQAVYQLMGMAWGLRKTLDSLKAELKTLREKTDNFDSLLENSDDETLVKYREALYKVRERLNAIQQEAANRMAELGMETTANLEGERNALKERIRATRKTLNLQLSVFDSYASTVQGVEKWQPLADAIRPPKTTVTAGSSPETVASTTDAGKVRQWAASIGLKVNERGRIPAEVYAAYAKANPPQPQEDDDEE